MTTPAENRKLWIDALRSGNYGQTQGRLRNGNNYCCLGVACDVYHKVTGLGEWKQPFRENGFEEFHDSNYSFSFSALPLDVQKWLGFTSNNGSFIDGATNDEDPTWKLFSLDELNDAFEWDFNRIADFIESNPKGLFIE